MGLGLTLVLVVLGGIRELVGQGTLFSGIDMVFGEAAKGFVLHVLPNYQGFLLAILPPGAFIALGLLIAANNWKKAAPNGAPMLPRRCLHEAAAEKARAQAAQSVCCAGAIQPCRRA